MINKGEKTVTEAINFRRSVRIYKDTPIDADQVKACIKNASLAPNSSNLQLWEFYHITSKSKIKEIATACFNQSAAKTAQQLVVVVVRKDYWRSRAKSNISFLNAERNIDICGTKLDISCGEINMNLIGSNGSCDISGNLNVNTNYTNS